MEQSRIDTEFIKLNSWLKMESIAATGGEAKYIIAEGRVKVNGVVASETRKKLYPGDTVEVDGAIYSITDGR